MANRWYSLHTDGVGLYSSRNTQNHGEHIKRHRNDNANLYSSIDPARGWGPRGRSTLGKVWAIPCCTIEMDPSLRKHGAYGKALIVVIRPRTRCQVSSTSSCSASPRCISERQYSLTVSPHLWRASSQNLSCLLCVRQIFTAAAALSLYAGAACLSLSLAL